MQNRTAATLLAGLLAIVGTAPAPAARSAPTPVESVMTMRVDGKVYIEPDGSVTQFEVQTKLVPALQAMLERSVLKWRFQPVLIDGVPRRVVSRMRISLAANKVGEDYQVHVDNIVFPNEPAPGAKHNSFENAAVSIAAAKLRPPAYPRGLMFAGVGGRVLLGIHVGADGRVQDVVSVQSMMWDVRGGDRALVDALRQFEQASLLAARGWTFVVSAKTTAPLAAKDTTVMVPVEFVMEGKPKDDPPGQWRLVTRVPKQKMPWLTGENLGTQDVGVADAGAGEMLPLASNLHLANSVVGDALR